MNGILADRDPRLKVFLSPEVSFLMTMKHERIVKMYGAGTSINKDKNGEGNVHFVVQEYMSGSSIDRILWNPNRGLDWDSNWKIRLTWACDVAEATSHIL